MVFSSLIFIYLFLPACLLCCGLSRFVGKSTTMQNIVLTLFSLAFYAWGEPFYVLLLLGSVLLNYLLGLGIGKAQRMKRPTSAKALLLCGLILNIGILVTFKYSGFLVENLNRIPYISLPVPKLRLPIGISFYTFQTLSYLIDVYWEKTSEQRNLLNFTLYISLFPQLIAGPIVRYNAIEQELTVRHATVVDFSEGITRFCMGLAKKVILANNLSVIVDAFLGQENAVLSVGGAWYAVIVYAMQVYFDFSGYSDMAIGMGRMLGFHFDENFRHPFLCKDISEFWQRWHISLGTFFRDYLLYIPIFGKRRKYGGLLLVWLCTGLWHGASWNYVLWGLYFGLFVMLEQAIGKKRMRSIPLVIRHLYSKLVIILGFAIFYFEDLGRLLHFFRDLFGQNGNVLFDEFTRMSITNNLFLLIVALLCCFPLYEALQKCKSRSTTAACTVGVAQIVINVVLLAVSSILLVDATNNPFLYLRF